jgi:hypothetical protein
MFDEMNLYGFRRKFAAIAMCALGGLPEKTDTPCVSDVGAQ